MAGKSNYTKYYAEYFKIEWDKKMYEVHHIDQNRENNNIDNLILLPKKLHRELHAVLNFNIRTCFIEPDSFSGQVERYMWDVLNGNGNWIIDVALANLMDVMLKCREWGFLKNMHYNAFPAMGSVKGIRSKLYDYERTI